MAYNYSKLLSKIIEVFGSQRNFAKAMAKSERTISLKLNNKRSWTQPEMKLAGQLLGFQESDYQDYFFTILVQ